MSFTIVDYIHTEELGAVYPAIESGINRIIAITDGTQSIVENLTIPADYTLDCVKLHLSAVGGLAENFTISISAGAGSRHNVLLYNQVMTTVSDIVWMPTRPIPFRKEDKIVITYNNGNNLPWGLEVLCRRQTF